jgi:RNA polymerase-associated protein LEO1
VERNPDDEQLDSGDDEGRQDRRRSESIQVEEKQVVTAQVQVPRHLIPQPGDNELYLLKVPPFLAVEPKVYQSQNFITPSTDHHSKEAPTPSFSAYNTAMSTIRWRHSPSDPSELQSNARVLRWSDGSLTLQLATDPSVQYELPGKPLAPPQQNPPKPTPTMAKANRRRVVDDESWTYVCSPLPNAFVVRTVGKVTTALQVQPPVSENAEENLKASIAALSAKYGNIGVGQKQPKIENFKGDPLQFEKDAQKIERELLRKQRKEERDKERNPRLTRPGGGGRAGGLTIDGLEGESTSRPRAQKSRGSGARRVRRDEYSDEEDEMYGRRGGPEDKYDMEDDFVVNSEEEDEGGSEDAEGESDMDIDVQIARNEKAQKRTSPKRTREEDEEEDDETGNNQGSPISRVKRRRVVSSDDEE